MFLRLTNVDAVLTGNLAASSLSTPASSRHTRHGGRTALEGDLPPPPGVLTAERPVPDDKPRKLDLAELGLCGGVCGLTSRWSTIGSVLRRTQGRAAWTGSEKVLELGLLARHKQGAFDLSRRSHVRVTLGPAVCGKKGPGQGAATAMSL